MLLKKTNLKKYLFNNNMYLIVKIIIKFLCICLYGFSLLGQSR